MRQATTRSLALLIFAVGTSSASAQDCRDSLKSKAGIVTAPAIEAQLRQNNIVNEPQVSIYAKDFTNSGISVAGEVAKPGFY